MAGYVCKIVLEDTHPPVWRRVMVPDRITFEELHEIIQILFGWENEHLHDFSIPADDIYIDDDDEFRGEHYSEDVTLVDSFFNKYKWIRYTYDFGDDWRHRINIEKIDNSYDERYVTLLKVKGNNFMEDSGGIWSEGNQCVEEYDADNVVRQLRKINFSKHEELDETVLVNDNVQALEQIYK